MKIDIYYSLAERKMERHSIEIPEGALLAECLSTSLSEAIAREGLSCAVWGRGVGLDYQLQAGDRVELVRDLRVDPMTARRERFATQGAKKAGLFKTRRQGAKAGY